MSWKIEIIVKDKLIDWVGSTRRFKTQEEADKYVANFVVKSDDPVNARWTDEDGCISPPGGVT